MTPSTTILDALLDILSDCEEIDSAALYGSFARGDNEPHSDVDLLVVCASARKRPLFRKLMSVLGGQIDRLSLSVYSQAELSFLSGARSLFLLHLSRESRIICDRSGFLHGVFNHFEPKKSYAADFEKSLDLLTPLKAVIANSPNEFHRLSYVYSLFRVFGVYLLANRGIYEFSKSRMTAALIDQFPQCAREIEELAALRTVNNNFFAGWSVIQGARDDSLRIDVVGCVEALGRLVCRRLIPDEVSYREAVGQFEVAAANQSRGLAYRHRAWFLLLLYDGLNHFCTIWGRPALTSLSAKELTAFTTPELPDAVNGAASVALDYLDNYPLRYFLRSDCRIQPQVALSALKRLSAIV